MFLLIYLFILIFLDFFCNQTKPTHFGPMWILMSRWSFRHLELQNPSIISDFRHRDRMVRKKVRRRRSRCNIEYMNIEHMYRICNTKYHKIPIWQSAQTARASGFTLSCSGSSGNSPDRSNYTGHSFLINFLNTFLFFENFV